MQGFFENLNKIEFVVTNACTGRCKHCSEGEHTGNGCFLSPDICADIVRKIASKYNLKTVMAFGGEPLLFPETVYAVMKSAFDMNVPKRQVITNGFFSKNPDVISAVAQKLAECGVNDLLVSADAFHQETIPLETVKIFVSAAKEKGIPVRIQPAWLVSPSHNNPFNNKTREIIKSFSEINVYENDGNIVFPEGNALKYLSEYFKDEKPVNPYIENPRDVRCISVSANGEALGGNIYRQDILDIIKNYAPK